MHVDALYDRNRTSCSHAVQYWNGPWVCSWPPCGQPCRKVRIEQYQRGNETVVGGAHDIVVDNHDGGVILSKGRLTLRKKTVFLCVVTYTINSQTVDYLRGESQIWDGLVRFCIVQIKWRLLNSGTDDWWFVRVRKFTLTEELFHRVSDDRCKYVDKFLHETHRNRIRLALLVRRLAEQ